MVAENKIIKCIGLFAALLLWACGNKDNKLEITFSKDSSAVVVSGIDPAGLHAIQRNTSEMDMSDLIWVIETPAEDDSTGREMEIPGKVTVQDNALWFIPDAPFVKGNTYLISTTVNMRVGGAKEMLKNELNTRLRPDQKWLVR